MTTAAIPDERAQRDPHGPCLADERQDLDNAQFASTVTAVAALFAAPVPVSSAPDTLALLIYTSGTTVRPKGVMLDHANITATAERVVAWFEMDRYIRCLLVLPLFRVDGIMVSIVSPLLAGGSTFIADRFDANTFWATVGRARPTFFSAVPTVYALLVSRPSSVPSPQAISTTLSTARE